jgi:thymidylate synthase
VPNKPKVATQKNRRAKLEEVRRQQRAAERRKTLVFVGVAAVIALGIVAAAAIPLYNEWRNDPANKSISDFGVALASAQCGSEETAPASGTNEHVGPGTQQPDVTKVKYKTVPPAFGQHYATPAPFTRKFYTATDRPPMEQLVHNLEHGYNVVWYDETITGEQLDDLRTLSEKIGNDDDTSHFIVSAWDPAYGAFPKDKHIGMSHWGAKQGIRQLCSQVSGEAIERFVKAHPKSDSPEPGAA